MQPLEPLPDPPESFQSHVPDYALLFFDHLFSEYLTLRSRIADPHVIALFESLHQKRLRSELTWSDIYTFDLALIDHTPLQNLVRKAYDARAKYRSIAGQKEFDEYLASKPPDLTTILIGPHNAPPAPAQPAGPLALAPVPDGPLPQPALPADPDPMPESAEIVQRVLRADIRYLLGRFYLYYAMLPMRENMREDLTSRAVKMTRWILAIIALLMLLSFGGGALIRNIAGEKLTLVAFGELLGAFGPIVGSVIFAGIVGGCVSMLQRIQSAPTEGDALFNLAALTHGWRGLSLSPLYGGIFASLLFVLFAAGILKGSVFPAIETTPAKKIEAAQTSTESQTNPATNSEATAPTTTATSTPAPTPAMQASQLPADEVLKIRDFLKGTGPKDGVAFALLMIWSFIAGFAERLVPDTLNRLIAKTEALQGTNT